MNRIIKNFKNHFLALTISLCLILLLFEAIKTPVFFDFKKILIIAFIINLSAYISFGYDINNTQLYLAVSSTALGAIILIDVNIFSVNSDDLYYIKIFCTSAVFAAGPFQILSSKHIDEKFSMLRILLPYVFAYFIFSLTTDPKLIYSYVISNAALSLYKEIKNQAPLSAHVMAEAFSSFILLNVSAYGFNLESISNFVTLLLIINAIQLILTERINNINVKKSIIAAFSFVPIILDQSYFSVLVAIYLLFLLFFANRLYILASEIDIGAGFLKNYLIKMSNFELHFPNLEKYLRFDFSLSFTICLIFIMLGLFSVI